MSFYAKGASQFSAARLLFSAGLRRLFFFFQYPCHHEHAVAQSQTPCEGVGDADAEALRQLKKALREQGFFSVKSVLDPPAAVMLVFGVIHPGLGLFDEGFDLDAAGAAGGAAHSHGVTVGLDGLFQRLHHLADMA